MTALVKDRIRPCTTCGRLTRPSYVTPTDAPGTVARGSEDLCGTCYARARRGTRPQPKAPTASMAALLDGFAESQREPQQSECRIGCCKNPFFCSRRFQCPCHGGVS